MRMSQQHLRFVRMLECNAQELEEAVDMEVEDNPALGVSEAPAEVPAASERSFRWVPQSQSEPGFEYVQPDRGESLYDTLVAQLSERRLSVNVESGARFIIGSLDPNGYLRRELGKLVDDMVFSQGLEVSAAEMREALEVVQSLDPPGIGASSLQECLLLQLRRLAQSPDRDNAIAIVENNFEAFVKKHLHKLVTALHEPEATVKRAIELIRTLNPKPGAALDNESDALNVIVPDFIVWREDNEVNISLSNRIPELQIERSFSEAMADLEHASRERRKANEFVMSRYRDAREFIKILTQRQQTMMDVMTAIVSIQKDYFMTDDVYQLKPMMIKDISAKTGLDNSVVSRATNNKYVATPAGTFPLRFFFSDAKSSDADDAEDGDVLTNRKIEAEIKKLVEVEDKRHPLSDEKIHVLMQARGYDLSRRTVAKYRDRLGIPVARLRKNP